MSIGNAKKIAVVGDGSWATAIVKILLNNVEQLNWYIRLKEDLDYIKQRHHNPRFLSSVELDIDKLNLYNSIEETVADADIIVFVIPSAYVLAATENCKNNVFKDKFIVSAVKGIIPEIHETTCDFLHNKFNVPMSNLGVVSGPCHAEEVALERLSYLTLSAENVEDADYLAKLFSCKYIKTKSSDDIFGTEYSAILKNIMAVASGIAHGLGYGDNFQSVLISNAIREMKRFVDEVHPITRDIKNSAYLGDLLVTAYSQFSRNRTFGNMIGKGYSVKSAQLEMNMVAEGYYAVKGIYEINKKYNVEMPITDAVYRILYEKISAVMEFRLLSDIMD
jgi:glycerol-3-phosphate dehydrogenase (NAD(P)+)